MISAKAVQDDDARMASPQLLRGRVSQIGSYYAVTVVAYGRRRVFTHGDIIGHIAAELDALAKEGRVGNLAWVAMPDHLHWLFRLRHGSLGSCLQRFKSRTTWEINRVAGTVGALWQAGYYEHRLRDESDLMRQARYLVENPLRKGLVERIED